MSTPLPPLNPLIQMVLNAQPATPEENALCLAKITRANLLLQGSPQFVLMGPMLVAVKHYVDHRIPTACTTGVRNYWNAKWLNQWKPKEIAFIVAHECSHSLLMHTVTARRLFEVDRQTAAQAIDHVVNNFLMDCDPTEAVIAMPREPDGTQNGTLDRKYQGWALYKVFQDLLQNKKPGSGFGPGGFDQHDFDGQTLTPEEEKMLRSAIEAGKRRAAGAQRNLLNAHDDNPDRRNWYDRLVQWMYAQGRGKGRSTWKTPNRRMIHQGIYLPSQAGKMLRKAGAGIDTSGSMGDDEVKHAVGIVKQVAKQCGVQELHLFYWDVGVQRHEIYKMADDKKLSVTKPAGGGGTSFKPVLDYIEKEGIQLDFMLNITDGYISDWGSKPEFPMLWCITTDVIAPYGETVRA